MAKSQSQLLAEYRREVRRSKQWRSDNYDDDWRRFIDLYRGKQIANASLADRLIVNMVFSTVNVLGPAVAVNNPKFVVNARRPEAADEHDADAHEHDAHRLSRPDRRSRGGRAQQDEHRRRPARDRVHEAQVRPPIRRRSRAVWPAAQSPGSRPRRRSATTRPRARFPAACRSGPSG